MAEVEARELRRGSSGNRPHGGAISFLALPLPGQVRAFLIHPRMNPRMSKPHELASLLRGRLSYMWHRSHKSVCPSRSVSSSEFPIHDTSAW